jgi:hypothetical protein
MNIYVDPNTAPAAGVAAPGDLYIDLQSRQMWLGVDTTVASTGSVLISDIMAIQPAIDSSTTTAKSYTDTQIQTRAPTVHTHLHTDITDFTAAVTNVVTNLPAVAWTRGMVMMYSGSMADIGVGNLVGWSLCDGTLGTPDLRDKFVVGAGNVNTGYSPAPVAIKTDLQGAHQHTNTAISLSVAQMPSHSHYVSIAGSGSGSATTDTQGNHNHNMPGSGQDNGNPGSYIETGNSEYWGEVSTEYAGSHAHNVSIGVNVSCAGYSNGAGSDAAHTHTMDSQGSHQHNISLSAIKSAIPYYALAFIMKL